MFVKKSVEEVALLSEEAFKLYQVEKEADEAIKSAKLVSDIEAVSKKNTELEAALKAQGVEIAKAKNVVKDDVKKSLITLIKQLLIIQT